MLKFKFAMITSLFAVAMMVASAADARARFYLRVCVDDSNSTNIVLGHAIMTEGSKVSLQLGGYIGGTGVFEENTTRNIRSCQYAGGQMVMIEDGASGDFYNWKQGDGQVVSNAMVFITVPKLTWMVPGGEQRTAQCSKLGIPTTWFVAGTQKYTPFSKEKEDWRIFNMPNVQDGLIRILVEFPSGANGAPACRLVKGF